MKKGLLLTLSAAAISFAAPAVHANAPVIENPGDIIVGDAEHHQAPANEFVFEDAINLGAIATDDNTTTDQLKWSYYTATTALYSLNGANVLADPSLSTAVLAPVGSQIQANDDQDTDDVKDANGFTVTFRNILLSPVGGPNTDPGVAGVVTTQTQTISLYASDGTTASSINIVVYSANDTSDSVSNGSLTQLTDMDFVNDPTAYSNWIGAVLGGSGSFSGTFPNGLCMTVPLTGNNNIGWVYVGGLSVPGNPNVGGLVKLVDGNVWQFTTTLGTSQTNPGQVPLLDFSFDNTVLDFSLLPNSPVVEASTYAGEHIIIDNSGSANAIGQPQGRTDFQFWMAPPAMELPQWKGLIDQSNSAFDASVDDSNDMNPTFRILDFDVAGIAAELDSGTICVKHITISSAPLANLRSQQQASYNLPINTANWFPANTAQGSEPGIATIDNTLGIAKYKLTNGDNSNSYVPGSLKTLFPFVAALVPSNPNFLNGDYNAALYPILWESNKLYVTEADVRSIFGGVNATVEGTQPVDVIQVSTIGPTTELVSQNFQIHGVAGNMDKAGSPRLTATLTSASLSPVQNFVGITYGHNKTLADVVANGPVKNGDHFTAQIQFLNSNGAILGAGTDDFGVFGVQTWNLGSF